MDRGYKELLEQGKYDELLDLVSNKIVEDIQEKGLSKHTVNILQQNYLSLKTVITESVSVRKEGLLNEDENIEALRYLEIIENKLFPNRIEVDKDLIDILSISPKIKDVYSPIYMGYNPLVLTVEYITMDYLKKVSITKGRVLYKGFIENSIKDLLESVCNIKIENTIDMDFDRAISIDLYNRLLLVINSTTFDKDFEEIIEESRRQISMCRKINDNISDRFINEVILAKDWYEELKRKDSMRLLELGIKSGDEVTEEFIQSKWNERLNELKESAYGEMGGKD